jgi:MFS family permease
MITPVPVTPAVSYGKLIRTNRNFRLLWGGEIVSFLGDWLNLIASASLIGALTGSGVAVGGLFVVRMLAPFLVSPFAGVVADRFNRKHIMVLTDILRAGIVLGFLLVRDASDIWLLYTLTAVQLGVSGFFYPARSAVLPNIVARNELGAANALTSATWSIMLALGTALGGLISGYFGAYTAFILDAITFLISALFLIGIRYTPEATTSGQPLNLVAFGRQYIDGLRYLVRHNDILTIALQKSWIGLCFGGGFQVLQVILGEQVFPIGVGGAVSMGLLFAATGVGTGIGPILARRYTGDRDRPLRVAIAVAFLMGITGIVVTMPLASFWMVFLGVLLRGLGAGTIWVFSTQLLLQLVPDEVRGRVFATEFALQTLTTAISAAFAGWMIDSNIATLNQTIGFLALLTIIPTVLWLRRLLPRPRLETPGTPAS